MLTFIEGEFTQPGPWSLDGAAGLGSLLRDLHLATRSFSPPPDAVWFPWRGRDLGSPVKVIGHCDVAPWNIVARDGLPVALIDWETAGPVDPLVELAQLAWLNAKLHDNVVAEREHLPPLADRARQLAAVVDAYGLTARQRRGFLDRIIEFAICDTAWEADDAAITPETTQHPIALSAMASRARSAAWMIRHRRTLEAALAADRREQPRTGHASSAWKITPSAPGNSWKRQWRWSSSVLSVVYAACSDSSARVRAFAAGARGRGRRPAVCTGSGTAGARGRG